MITDSGLSRLLGPLRRYPLTIGLLVLVAAAALATTLSSSTERRLPESPRTAARTLACPPNDRMLKVQVSGPDSNSGATSPIDAHRSFLKTTYPGHHPVTIELYAATATRGQVVHGLDGRRVATSFVDRVGASWHVMEFVACNSLMFGYEGGR